MDQYHGFASNGGPVIICAIPFCVIAFYARKHLGQPLLRSMIVWKQGFTVEGAIWLANQLGHFYSADWSNDNGSWR